MDNEDDAEAQVHLHTDPARIHALHIQSKVWFTAWARSVGYRPSEVAQVMLVDDEHAAVRGINGELH